MRKKLLAITMSLIMAITFMPSMALTAFADTPQQTSVKTAAADPAKKYAYEETLFKDLQNGDKCIIVANGYNTQYAMTSELVEGQGFKTTDVSLNEDDITEPGDAAVWTVEKEGNKIAFKSDDNYIALDGSAAICKSTEPHYWVNSSQGDYVIKSAAATPSTYLSLGYSSDFTTAYFQSLQNSYYYYLPEIHFYRQIDGYDRQISIIPSRGVSNSRNITLSKGDIVKVSIINTTDSEKTYTLSESEYVTADTSVCTVAKKGKGLVTITAGQTAAADAALKISSEDGYRTDLHIKIVADASKEKDAPDSSFKKTGTINLAVASDIHGSLDELDSWQKNLISNKQIKKPKKMIFCGDYSYNYDLSSYITDYGKIVKMTSKNMGKTAGIYTSGNHEYQTDMGDTLDPVFEKNTAFKRIGWAVNPKKAANKYGVYCLGAAGWFDSIGSYPAKDIESLKKALAKAPANKPVFIAAHFPLHTCDSRTTENALRLINVLNAHPNVIFLWGHNHSQGDSHYGQILPAGEKIEYAAGRSKEINFTYACAGAMYSGQKINYRGLVANVTGKKVTMQYLGYNGETVSDATKVSIQGEGIEDPGDILEIDVKTDSDISKTLKEGESFTLNVINNSTSANEFSITPDNEGVSVDKSKVTIQAGETAAVSVKALKAGKTNIEISRSGITKKVKLSILNKDGSAPEEEEQTVITPSTSNPTVKKSIKVGETVKFTIANDSAYSNYTFALTNSSPDTARITDSEQSEDEITSLSISMGSNKDIYITGLTDGKTKISMTNNNSYAARTAVISLTVGTAKAGTKYLAIGDSIGAGVRGGGFSESPEYNAYNTYGPNGEKNWDVNAVPYSYINLFANDINADSDNSWNGSAAGLRAKEICYMLDLKAYKGDGYNYDLEKVTWKDLEKADFDISKLDIDDYYGWAMGNQMNWKKLFSPVNKDEYKKAVKNADVITVQLGPNEFNAFTLYGPLLTKIVPTLQDAIKILTKTGDYNSAAELKDISNKLSAIIRNPDETQIGTVKKLLDKLQETKAFAKGLIDIGISFAKLYNETTDSLEYAYKSYRYYWKTLMTYIRKVNPNAVIVTTTVPSPVKGLDMSTLGDLSAMGIDLGGIDISKIDAEGVVDVFIKDMNNYLEKNASKYNYTIADITDVSLNPTTEDGKPDPNYRYHPNNEGHKQIETAIKTAYDNAGGNKESTISKIITSIKNAVLKIFDLISIK